MTTIDEKIETHVLALIAEAYPEVETDEVIFVFSRGQFDFRTGYRREAGGSRHIVGTDRIETQIQIQTAEKLNRYAMISRLPPVRVDLGDGETAFRRLAEWRQFDYVEAVGMKAIQFTITFDYEVCHAVAV